METIDRYIQAVTERLPEDAKEEVARELRANIEDMLPENPTEADIRAVLEKLGNPAHLAREYRQEKRYLIGPDLYDTYLTVLKLVVGIAAIAFTFLSMIGFVTEPAGSFGDIFGGVFSAAFEGAVMGFLWVTVVFAVLERTGMREGKLPTEKKPWTVEDLPPVQPRAGSKIGPAEPVVNLIFNVIFVSILIFKPELFGWFHVGAEGTGYFVTVFDLARLGVYIPFMIILAVFQFGMSIYKFIARRWTLPLAVINTIHNLGSALLVCLMFNDMSVFNPEVFARIGAVLNLTAEAVAGYWARGMVGFSIFVAVMSGIDSITGFVKASRVPALPKKLGEKIANQ